MHISILAGSQTQMFENLLHNKEGFQIYSNPDISEGLKEIDYTIDTNIIILTDAAFIKNGKQLDIAEVISALKLLANKNLPREILLITKNEELKTAFEGILLECSNTRAVKVEKINSRVLIDCIFNRYKENNTGVNLEKVATPIQETTELFSAPEPEPVAPPPTPEPIPEPPKPTPAPAPEPPKPTPTPKPKKKLFSGESKINLYEAVPRNKIVVFTGNHNSGTTSTICNMASLLANSGLKTLIVDLEIQTKGINMYYNILDTDACTKNQKVGLIESLEDLEQFQTSVVPIVPNLHLLGTHSNCIANKIEKTVYDDMLVSDLINYAMLDYDIVLVHIPFEYLIKLPTLIKYSSNIVYSTEATINAISHIDFNLNPANYISNMKRDIQILTRKLCFFICNYITNTVTMDNFHDYLAMVTENDNICRPIIGIINHINNFDNFTETKNLISDKKVLHNISTAILNIFKI